MPVLELDDGTTLSESVSICRYLEELYPTPPLFGTTPIERARIDMWSRRMEFVLMAPISAVWVHTHALTAALGKQFHEYGEAQRIRVGRAMAWLDRELLAGPFIAGERFSMADITALSSVDFGRFIGIELPEACERLRAWRVRVSDRPSAAA